MFQLCHNIISKYQKAMPVHCILTVMHAPCSPAPYQNAASQLIKINVCTGTYMTENRSCRVRDLLSLIVGVLAGAI